MSDYSDPNKHIRKYLRDYLSQDRAPGYAVMIRGAWGIGKTFLIRDILAKQFPENSGYIYVSLYGVSTPDEIDAAILAAMYPVLGTKMGKITGRLLHAGMKYFRVDGALAVTDVINRTSEAVYIFDDLERSSMNPDAIFGYINQFVEHAGCRVVLVANEAEMEKAKGYRTKREKLVGQTLEAKSAVRGALATFLADVSDAEASEYLKSVQEKIVDLYEQGDVDNLRVLKQTLWDFQRFYRAIEPHHRQHARAMLHILQLLFAFSFEIKLGRLHAEDLKGRRDHWIAAAIAKDTGVNINASFDRYGGLDLSDTTLSDELLTDLLIRGVVDEALVRRDLSASSWFLEPKDEPSWRTIWHRLEREEDAVSSAISALQTEVEAFRFQEPGEILHVFGIMLMMSDAAMIPADRDSVVEAAKSYITTLREKGQLPPLTNESYMENIGHGSWGGLGITEVGTPHYREIYAHLNDQRAQARLDRLPALAERLLTELDEDVDLFCRRLVSVGGEESDLIDGPVLKEIDPERFLAAVLRQPAQVQIRVFQCLLSRHGRRGFDRALQSERSWARSLHDAMVRLAEASDPIGQDKLATFAAWVCNDVQGDAESDESVASTPE